MIYSLDSDDYSQYVYTEYDELASPNSESCITYLRHNAQFYTCMAHNYIRYLCSGNKHYWKPGDAFEWKISNTGLFVFVMGLNGHVVFATPYLRQILAERADFEVRIPHVPHEGNCSLEEAAKPIADMILNYHENFPHNKISLIGVSNGGRISLKVSELCKNVAISMRVVGIAGCYFGSTAPWIREAKEGKFHPAIMEDLQLGSETSKNLIREMQLPLEQGKREYAFYAIPDDALIPNVSSSFPKLGQGESKYLLPAGWSHFNISLAVQDQELKRSYQWFDQIDA